MRELIRYIGHIRRILPFLSFVYLIAAGHPAFALELSQSGEMKVLVGSWPLKDVDPLKHTVIGEVFILENLYATLTEVENEITSAPGLAESWERNADATRWRFHIRKNARWSDGAPISADQVAESLRRSLAGASHVKLSSYVSDVTVQDTHVVEVRLRQPVSGFLTALSMVEFSIVHPESYKKGSFTWSAPVSGPFVLKSFSKDEYILSVNTHYWLRRRDSLREVKVVAGSGSNGDAQRIIKEPFDIAKLSPGTIVTDKDLPELRKVYQVFAGKADFLSLLSFSRQRTKAGTLPRDVRRYLLRKIYSEYWKGQGAIPERATGFRSKFSAGSISVQQFERIVSEFPERAPKSYPKELRVLIWAPHADRPVVREIIAVLRRLPGRVEVMVRPTEEYKKLRNSGEFDLRIGFLSASSGDPDIDWRLFHESYFAASVASSEEFDAALLERNEEKRMNLYREFERRALSEALFIPLRHETSYLFTAPGVLFEKSANATWGLPLRNIWKKE